MPRSAYPPTTIAALVLAGCGGGGTGPTVTNGCDEALDLTLSAGETRLVDARAESGCIRLAGAPEEQQYLVVAYSGSGQETSNGISGPYRLVSALAGGGQLQASSSAAAGLGSIPGISERFHQSLRAAESRMVSSGAASASQLVVKRQPPEVGEKDDFNVCSSLDCDQFESVTATARYVGSSGVIWIDDDLPTGADDLTGSDIDALGAMFDDYLLPIDTTAFGATSDIDSNGLVEILVTDQVNALTEDCTNGRIVGYTFGGDLLPSNPGSNQREIFFTFAPAPATSSCPAVGRTAAMRSLLPVLIHELQHMISFNQRVLLRARAEEQAWLNEALSHFAEELGQRLIPDDACPLSSSCFDLFGRGNTQNGYEFLENPVATALVAPSSGLTLANRGAAWLFLRWLADHFSTDTLTGRELTRALLTSSSTGASSVSSITGVPFATLVGEWLMANWLEDLPGFAQTGRLRYRSWNLRALYAANHPQLFQRPYPLVPRATSGGSSRSGTLNAGSGDYLLVTINPASDPITIELTSNGSSVVAAELSARFAVVRIR